MPTNYGNLCDLAQFVKQNTNLLQVLTKQEEGDVAIIKYQCHLRLDKAITRCRYKACGKICIALRRLKFGSKD
jgi:hypothetical protein